MRLKYQCYRKSLIIDIFYYSHQGEIDFSRKHSENNSVAKKAFPRLEYHLQNVKHFSLLIFLKDKDIQPNVNPLLEKYVNLWIIS